MRVRGKYLSLFGDPGSWKGFEILGKSFLGPIALPKCTPRRCKICATLSKFQRKADEKSKFLAVFSSEPSKWCKKTHCILKQSKNRYRVDEKCLIILILGLNLWKSFEQCTERFCFLGTNIYPCSLDQKFQDLMSYSY